MDSRRSKFRIKKYVAPGYGRSDCGFPFGDFALHSAAVAKASKLPLSGGDILRFLRSFEGAAATFGCDDERWTLWLPEMTSGDHPLTPASQVFFPVILRHGQQAIAIRFLYDCSLGKVRYHTSAIPGEIVSRPEFENAVSELFRHSLSVEPMRERKLSRDLAARLRKPEPPPVRPTASLAEPVDSSALGPARTLVVRDAAPAAATFPESRAVEPEVRRSVRLEIGPRARTVLMCLILAVAFVALAVLGTYTYLQATQDPGVLHHRLELEQLRLRR